MRSRDEIRFGFSCWLFLALIFPAVAGAQSGDAADTKALAEINARLARETMAAYDACRFSALSKDYFSRFARDPDANAATNEIALDTKWRVCLPAESDPLARLMAEHLQTFLSDRMQFELAIEEQPAANLPNVKSPAIVLLDSGGGDASAAESFTIRVEQDRVTVQGDSPAGLRDGVVRLVDRIGLREAPILELGTTVYKPRLPVRLGAVPAGGSYKDLVFFGFNAVLQGGGDLYTLSQSNAIPELAVRRVPGALESNRQGMKELAKYGLKAYAWLNTRQKFPKDDPVFKAHPEIRGALTWAADGEYTLCTSHPLVRQYLKESVQGLFRSTPELKGVVLIIGGEGFYHCHMRPFGVEKGHTNCARCEKLGADEAVADLCNDLADAARSVTPDAEIVVWPYSAEYVWASDAVCTGFLAKLKPGVALLTEIEKSEIIEKPHGVRKDIWDYSIDFIGPATRTRQQIAVCKQHGIPVHVKSEPELGFEAPRLPQIPCMDRWADRAEVLASCGATGGWVFPAFRPFYGTSTGEINKFLWWTPVPEREALLKSLAQRVAGKAGGKALRDAWRSVSLAIESSPELPSYYTGPYYLGPLHPMCANKSSTLPNVFFGQYLFRAELKDSEGLMKRPTFFTDPNGNVPVFGEYYRAMEKHLARAAANIRRASPYVDDRHRLTFDAEASPVLWFYHTARTHANFYESCQLRDAVQVLLAKPNLSAGERDDVTAKIARWKEVLVDELKNTEQALPVLQGDMRLDPYYGGDHTFPHGEQMIKAKLTILRNEIDDYLPSLAGKISK